jgi:inositol 1,4,5-triphosphate receptor type 1
VETCCYIFLNNSQLCKTITEKHVQHFVHLIELHGRKVLFIKFLQTIIKAENQYIKNCQDIVMSEVIQIKKNNKIQNYLSIFLVGNI